MTLTQTQNVRAELTHAISVIQSEWSPRERVRRQRLAELRQQRLVRMVSPQPRLEAYDCQCDLADKLDKTDPGEPESMRRSHRYVLLEG